MGTKVPPPVSEQYATGAYADFVEDPQNDEFYRCYANPSFLRACGPLDNVRSVLDVGCGSGPLISVLRQAKSTLTFTGVDQSSAMLKRARRNHPERGGDGGTNGTVRFVRADFLSPGAADDSGPHDLVVSGFVTCHLERPDDLRRYFGKVLNRTKAGGLTVHLVPPTGDGPDGGVSEASLGDHLVLYDIHWSRDTYVRVMTEVGFEEVGTEDFRASEEFGRTPPEDWTGYYVLKGRRPSSS